MKKKTYELDGIIIDENGFLVDGKKSASWTELWRILQVLPRVAHRDLGWFPSMGPPSSCIEAASESTEIAEGLFKKKD